MRFIVFDIRLTVFVIAILRNKQVPAATQLFEPQKQ